jgi:CO/xanthine dehydrogenase Mo-binding subunit
VRIASAHVYTNTIPGGYMRGPGEAQGIFALESHLDEIARELGMDPVEFKLKNLIVEGDEAAFGMKFEGVRAKETLQRAVEAAGFSAPKAANVGRGVAIGERPAGGGEASAAVTFRPDGRVVVSTPIYDQGTGVYTIMRQVVAEELQIPQERIDIEIWDTDAVPSDSGVAGSWATRLNTNVAYEAAQTARTELLRFAAAKLGWPEEQLSLRGEEVWRRDIEEKLSWAELLSRTGESVTGKAHHFAGMFEPPHITSFNAQVAEVSVDRETGEVRLLRLTSAHDVGRVINPIGHQGQINGGIVTGVGYALMEEMIVEDGRVTSLSFGDYKLPTIADVPELRTVILESDVGAGPYRVKAIGELPASPVAPAIANAIADATGVRIRDLPITAEKVYRALKQ